MKTDFRFDKIFLEPFIAVNEDDFPDNFSEGEYEEEEEIEYFFPVKNLTFDGKV